MSAQASPAELAARHAVAANIEGMNCVIVACSGGPDSVALAGAATWVGKRQGVRVGAVVIDHQLQVNSDVMAKTAAESCTTLGLSPVFVRKVTVTHGSGLEAGARDARYAALYEVADEVKADAILLGHTRDDQAETVLLRLLRGAGARSLAAMRAERGLLRRPFLDLPRDLVHAVAQDLANRYDLQIISDPQNQDPGFSRVRIRQMLADWPQRAAAVTGLVRSAALLADDADYLDSLANSHAAQIGADPMIAALIDLPRAIRTRVLRILIIQAGAPAGTLTFDHVMAVEALVSHWHGQGDIALPGGLRAWREYGRLRVQAAHDERES